MKLRTLVLFLLFTAISLFSQEINKDVKEALKQINELEIKSHILFLSDDLLEGRKTGTYGNDVASKYIASQFEAAGILPVCDTGKSYFQPMKLIGILMDHNMTLKATGKNGTAEFKYYGDFIGFCGQKTTEMNIKDADVIFVGYGIDAPEYNWNDFKDINVKGKILLVMNNDPADDPKIFEGETRTYYGRWTYKYEEAARKGALGAIIIHTVESAAYGWQVVQTSWSNEEFALSESKDIRLQLDGWLTEEASKKLVTLGGFNFDELIKSANSKTFKSAPLNVKISINMKSKIREVDTRNVIGFLSGSDSKLKNEYVIYTSHFDHLGIGPAINGDSIYNGAFDNATGVSSLICIAKAFKNLEKKPKRSILFIATAAEEEGTLGSEYFCQNPTVDPLKMIAELNIDGVSTLGIAKNVEIIGGKYSNLLETINDVAKKIGMYAIDDQEPNGGYFYRSDQFPFVKIGVPGVFLGNGKIIEGKPEGWGNDRMNEFEKNDYHQPSDEVKSWWNYEGMTKNTQLYFLAGLKIANDLKTPQWKKGTDYDTIRKKSLGK
jgi:Zn-dependent M28 family amino/carboxypeptidase